ncbi:MAG TPA: hypothetical protein VIM03_04400, partial [Thermoleophilaceae bacterium]
MPSLRRRSELAYERTIDLLWLIGTTPRRMRERIPYYRFRLHLVREHMADRAAAVAELPGRMLGNRRALLVASAVFALLLAAGASAAIISTGSDSVPARASSGTPAVAPPAGVVDAQARERAAKAAARARARREHARRANAAARRRAATRRKAAARRRAAAARRHKAHAA